jgi:hypothetical protein
MRLLLKLIAFFVLLFSLFMIYDHYQLTQTQKMEALKRIDPLPETLRLVDEDRYAEAADYLAFFMQFEYVKENPKAKELYEALEQKRNSMEYQSQKVMEGVIKGTSDETIGKVSAGISDFFLFGDLRDLSIEGYHYLKGDEVDNVLVALSTIGVVATGMTMLSAGTSSGVKGGVSALKLIRKSNKMPLWMEKFIIRSAKQVKHSGDIKPVKTLFEDIYTVTKASGFNTTLKLLEKSPNLKSFRNSIGFAKMFGKESSVLMKILGDDAPLYYRLLKDKSSKKTFLKASTYGKPGIKRLAKVGEKRFLKSITPIAKVSRLSKVFNKNIVHLLHQIPVALYILMAMISLVMLV